MDILITGSSGLVGSALLHRLHSAGHTLYCLQRNSDRNSKQIWDTDRLLATSDDTPPCFHTVIHLAGENVAEKRWTTKVKQRILGSRKEGTRQLIDFLGTLDTPPENFFCASATGYYGNRGSELVSETAGLGAGFLADVCRQWEYEAQRAEKLGARVVLLRFGMVLSNRGGALQKMLPPFRVGLGGPIGRGGRYMSWVSIRDLVEIIHFVLINENVRGAVNVVSPTPVTNAVFSETLGKVLGKPAKCPVPPAVLRFLLGEMADEMLLTSVRVRPAALEKNGYVFSDTDLKRTLEYYLAGR